jgi:membrane dipeptidase
MDLPRLREGGIDLQVLACWVPTDIEPDSACPRVDYMIDTIDAQIARYGSAMTVCLTAEEARAVVADGRLAAFIGIENGVAIANDLENLRHFYARGVRYMTLTHTASSDWCISSADTAPAFHGLTDFGREVVREMNRLGMIIDISHAHAQAVDLILETTTDPVIASHSCVHALCAHDRNLTDAQIAAIAENGGVIGINFFNAYLSEDWNRISDSLWEIRAPEYRSYDTLYAENDTLRWTEQRRIRREVMTVVDSLVTVDVGTVCDHIDHIVNLVGDDYVGLGSDYDGVYAMPAGLDDCSKVPNITKELMARGYSEKSIRKILGGNFMRVFEEVCGSA